MEYIDHICTHGNAVLCFIMSLSHGYCYGVFFGPTLQLCSLSMLSSRVSTHNSHFISDGEN